MRLSRQVQLIGKGMELYADTYGIHFEVDEFPSGESDHNLTLIDRAFYDGLLTRCLPFVDTLICSYMTYTIRIYLKRCLINVSNH